MAIPRIFRFRRAANSCFNSRSGDWIAYTGMEGWDTFNSFAAIVIFLHIFRSPHYGNHRADIVSSIFCSSVCNTYNNCPGATSTVTGKNPSLFLTCDSRCKSLAAHNRIQVPPHHLYPNIPSNRVSTRSQDLVTSAQMVKLHSMHCSKQLRAGTAHIYCNIPAAMADSSGKKPTSFPRTGRRKRDDPHDEHPP